MRAKIIALLLSVLLVGLTFCSCGSSEAKVAYKPPARVFDVEIEGTNEPKIDGVEITYDSKARIDTVSYSIDGYDYKQEYSYDTDQIVIKTIYKTEVIEEKVIKYVEIPVTSGFAEVDGYIVRVTEDMPVESNSGNDPANKDTETPTKKPTEKQTDKPKPNTEKLEKGVWILYSPQYAGFYAYSFYDGAAESEEQEYRFIGSVTRTEYDYHSSKLVKKNTKRYSYMYSQYGNDLVIYEDNSEFLWIPQFQQDRIMRSYTDISGVVVNEYMYHHDEIPNIETIKSECKVQPDTQLPTITEDEALDLVKEKMGTGYGYYKEGIGKIDGTEYYFFNVNRLVGDHYSHIGHCFVTLDGKHVYLGDADNKGHATISREL